MRCIVIIPARFASVRFPGKPLALLSGKPMIVHVAERCARADGIDRVLVATDDDRIAGAVREAGYEAVMTPPDLASGTDRVAAAAAGEDADVVVNVQGDEPLLDPVGLGAAVTAFLQDGADLGTLRAPLTEVRDLWDPNVVKVVVDREGRALYFSRAPVPFPRAAWLAADNRAGLPQLRFDPAELGRHRYWAHVGVYLYRRQALMRWARMPPSALEVAEGLEQLRVLEAGESLQTYQVRERPLGVDTPEDLERARLLLEAARGGGPAGEASRR